MADTDTNTASPSTRRIWAKRLGWALAIVLTPLALAALFLSTPIGKRFVADQIASIAPASGLRFEVGRIEGDIYSDAVLRDVVLKDPKGVFLTVPEVELNWRPLAWIWSGLDIRELTARRGRLERLPELLPGDPDAPILPDFDIRIDKLALENFKLSEGVAGDIEQRVDFTAAVDIRKGRALIEADGKFGTSDTLALLLDAEPDGDRFDLNLDYKAAADGPIARLTGLSAAYRARVLGEGTWGSWTGHGLVTRQKGEDAAARVAAFRLTNESGRYGLLGMVTPRLESGSLLDRSFAGGLAVNIAGTLEESLFDGTIIGVSDALDVRGQGEIDLARNRVDGFDLNATLRNPDLLAPAARFEDARLAATFDGRFSDLTIDHELTLARLVAGGGVSATQLANSGEASFNGSTLRVPINVTARAVETGNAAIDPRLVDGRLDGMLTISGNELAADNTRITFPDLTGDLSLRGNLAQGAFALAGPVRARSLSLDGVGEVTAEAKLLAKFGSNVPWSVRANFAGVAGQFTNGSIRTIAGKRLRFAGALGVGAQSPLVVRDVVLTSDLLEARLDTRIAGGRTTISGAGSQARYGDFAFDAELAPGGPRADVTLANPYPPAGVEDVRLTIAPEDQGFAIDVAGQSMLGPFEGALALQLPQDSAARIDIDALRIYRTNVTGSIALGEEAVSGDLAVAGGGLDGTISLSAAPGGGQAFDVDLAARSLRFGGDVTAAVAYADITANGSFSGNTSRVQGSVAGRDLEFGALKLHAFDARSQIVDGTGTLQASIAGRRADRFQLKLDGNFAPSRIALIASGEYGGRPITMPRRAVLTALDEGGYALAPTQIGFARGFTLLEGRLGGDETVINASFAQMPLRLADLVGANLGLGGRLSGKINVSQNGNGPLTGNAKFKVDGFTRSGLVLSSRPVDIFAVANLSPGELAVGARLTEDDKTLGRLDARINGIGRGRASGQSLTERIMQGRLDASLGYDGAAEALWRLLAIETFDLTGPAQVEARATGTLASPRITGDLAGDGLRLQSAVSGTDVRDLSARGRFVDSRLNLTRFSGTTDGGGTISGSGSVNLANVSSERGPQIDLRLAANDARLLNATGLEATITGPLRIVSSGVGGTIAGRVTVDRASWALGTSAEDMSLPNIATREIGGDVGQAFTSTASNSDWRYLIDAKAPSRVAVDGLGLDSEWGIDIRLRGTVSDPRIGGEARLVRGDYRFANTRFELTDGLIEFDANVPIDPRLDIEARASADGTNVTIDITGNAQRPEIAFSSTPALPEEEILARLLYGGSVTSLSATDAIQLGAALAALQGGGGGPDPIGALRRSIGLDQLRIVSADPALGRGTGVALGKNLGRRAYVELVTDGQGYSATQVEYRITSWLALLGSVTTIGRDSVLAEISRDY
ncbi:translocation/assembly module TamB domain-containing protein [Erythrobacter sp. SCSIO 43205]|uniref:translocation/assembly module TamB domain-containing protein n=1 Tax=Erythrobacter sp. SCSIO 43205 TaxID=2779361 RepID=UPI001CA937EE|nr:translocation/assembly module TamB domain-containing protein [Erythrobacter sp. SCSIO 43205]UAB79137.1 translocation/assembly module TamB domain-containing protein [Erythrobacter sp. SCSIO 43205]